MKSFEKRMRVGLVYNLKEEDEPPQSDLYAEYDSEETISAMENALLKNHDVVRIEADENMFEKLKSAELDIVFNVAEGTNGPARESQVPCVLDMLSIPYTGSDPITLAICLDKARAKEILHFYNIPTPRFEIFYNSKQKLNSLEFPVIVKPLREGSSKGIRNNSVVHSKEELEKVVYNCITVYNQPALVEEYLTGREFTCALLGNGKVQVLPIVEMVFNNLPKDANPIYSFEAKWVWDTPDHPVEIFECPADIPASLEKKIRTICIKAYRILNIRDWCRIDLRLDKEEIPNILELNPIPGILPKPEENSCFPKAARASGIDYDELINRVLKIASKRCGLI